MKQPRIWESNIKPNSIEKLSDNSYYYNYIIGEDNVQVEKPNSEVPTIETRYYYLRSYLSGAPNYKEAIVSIIRQYVSVDDEIALINKYNTYNLGLDTDQTACNEYEDYCLLVSDIRKKVKEDFNISSTDD